MKSKLENTIGIFTSLADNARSQTERLEDAQLLQKTQDLLSAPVQEKVSGQDLDQLESLLGLCINALTRSQIDFTELGELLIQVQQIFELPADGSFQRRAHTDFVSLVGNLQTKAERTFNQEILKSEMFQLFVKDLSLWKQMPSDLFTQLLDRLYGIFLHTHLFDQGFTQEEVDDELKKIEAILKHFHSRSPK